MTATDGAPSAELAPAVPDVPIRCTWAPVYQRVVPVWTVGPFKIGQRPVGDPLMAIGEQCQEVATWDEFYRCEEGGEETGHRCDVHHAQALDPQNRTMCWPHGGRHTTVLMVSYPRRSR